MIKKKIKEVLSYILAEKENFSFENRIFLSSILIGLFLSILGAIIGLFHSRNKFKAIINLP